MRALQFTESGSVSNLRLIELRDAKADSATAIVKVTAGAIVLDGNPGKQIIWMATAQ